MRNTEIDWLMDGHALRDEQSFYVDRIMGGEVPCHIRVYEGGTFTGVAGTRNAVPAGATYTEEFQDGARVGEPFTGVGGKKYVFVHKHGSNSSLGGIPVKMVEVKE